MRWSLLLLVACSTKSPPPPPAIIEVKEITVRFDDMPIARLHADGRTESVGDSKPGKDAKFSPGPTLHADGTIDLTKAGFQARVESDGDIFIVSPGQPDQLYGRLSGDQILTDDAGDSGVRLEGARLVTFRDGKQTNVLGVVDPPSARRTALILTAAFFIDLAITSR